MAIASSTKGFRTPDNPERDSAKLILYGLSGIIFCCSTVTHLDFHSGLGLLGHRVLWLCITAICPQAPALLAYGVNQRAIALLKEANRSPQTERGAAVAAEEQSVQSQNDNRATISESETQPDRTSIGFPAQETHTLSRELSIDLPIITCTKSRSDGSHNSNEATETTSLSPGRLEVEESSSHDSNEVTEITPLSPSPDGGISLKHPEIGTLNIMHCRCLDGRSFLVLFRLGLLELPTPAEMKLCTKAPTWSKILVLMGLACLCFQFIVRLLYGLPITLLEVFSLVQTTCTVLVFLYWWLSGQCIVKTPTFCKGNDLKDVVAFFISDDTKSSKDANFTKLDKFAERMIRGQQIYNKHRLQFGQDLESDASTIPSGRHEEPYTCDSLDEFYILSHGQNSIVSIASFEDPAHPLRLLGVLTGFSILYGGGLSYAWCNTFPTVLEMWLWRGSIMWQVIGWTTFSFLLCSYLLRDIQTAGNPKRLRRLRLHQYLITGSLGLNLLVDLLIFAISWGSLRRVPVGTYTTVPWLGWCYVCLN
ncbi:hypothetical protein MMC25_004838 [Agyrium rufum]|nr:hypothetical protein [Agyrium rufum]